LLDIAIHSINFGSNFAFGLWLTFSGVLDFVGEEK
jgi:hypothetical protein